METAALTVGVVTPEQELTFIRGFRYEVRVFEWKAQEYVSFLKVPNLTFVLQGSFYNLS